MRALIGGFVFMSMGIAFLFVSKNDRALIVLSRISRTPHRAAIAAKIGAFLLILLSLVCLAAFAAWMLYFIQ